MWNLKWRSLLEHRVEWFLTGTKEGIWEIDFGYTGKLVLEISSLA